MSEVATRGDMVRQKLGSTETNKEIAKRFMDEGFCTHYAGFTCDKDFTNGACYRCILGWLRQRAGGTQ